MRKGPGNAYDKLVIEYLYLTGYSEPEWVLIPGSHPYTYQVV